MGVLPLSLPRLSLSWALCLSPREPVWTHEMYALLTVLEVHIGYQG
jgi:hypothetical protein